MIFFLLLLLSPEGLISSIALESQFASLFPSPLPQQMALCAKRVIFKMSPPSLTNKASSVLKFVSGVPSARVLIWWECYYWCQDLDAANLFGPPKIPAEIVFIVQDRWCP